jgi:hypothetical protein
MVTLQDVMTILIGTVALGVCFAVGGWAWEHRVHLANRYLSFNALQRWDVPILHEYWTVDDADNMSSANIGGNYDRGAVLVSDTDTDTRIPILDTAYLAANLTEAQRLEVMALAKTVKGKWVYSGKKLYAVFGGNYNEFVATMRRLRGETDADPPEEPMMLTPFAGRPTKASYYESDPELEYQAPR